MSIQKLIVLLLTLLACAHCLKMHTNSVELSLNVFTAYKLVSPAIESGRVGSVSPIKIFIGHLDKLKLEGCNSYWTHISS